jgi:multidrug efflux pump subunit AcrB
VDEDKIPGAVVRKEAEKQLAHFNLPPGYNIKFTGEEDMQKEAEEFLSKAFLIAVFLVIIILVAMFNSILQVTIIMISVLLSLWGVFFGLTVMNYPFGIIMTGVGVISLVGVVVNNAIVLIDYTNKLCERGMEVREAIIAAGCTRLRPVFLTAITTILGLIPMVTGVSYDFPYHGDCMDE